MDLDDSTRRMLTHLESAPDAYLLRLCDFFGLFTLWDRLTLENPRPDSVWAIPGEVLQRLESAGHIKRFEVPDKTQIGLRISTKARDLPSG
jgi:hypothetical protein